MQTDCALSASHTSKHTELQSCENCRGEYQNTDELNKKTDLKTWEKSL